MIKCLLIIFDVMILLSRKIAWLLWFLKKDLRRILMLNLLIFCYLLSCTNNTKNEVNSLVGTWVHVNDATGICEYLELEVRELELNGVKSYYWSMYDSPEALYQFDATISNDTLCLMGLDACVAYTFIDENKVQFKDGKDDFIWNRINNGRFDPGQYFLRSDKALADCLARSSSN